MNKISLALTALVAGLVVASPASAQSFAPSWAGASIGSTDYGTGLKVYLGGKVTPIFGWEGQVVSHGSEDFAPGRKHSAVSLGGSAVARFPLNSQFTAFGKAGLHYLRVKRSGPGVSSDSDLELGLGAGMLFNITHTTALRLEYENIGGGDGDFFSIGLQFSF
ncbi:porin family protein [Piscinibacter gummiphilus]|uniref:Porin family protein n=1 Tax=Piscinibacter gummiphilus TaxID=946333 RepID=A0ABZ0D1D8_9BURK|nr:porin family protein [Piscinibacter gummiphilus]WOB09105.1 porin family protein [Piscinibacter gummiphilus]